MSAPLFDLPTTMTDGSAGENMAVLCKPTKPGRLSDWRAASYNKKNTISGAQEFG